MFDFVIPDFVLKFAFVAAVLYASHIFEKFSLRFLHRFLEKKAQAEELDQNVISFMRMIIRVLLWLLVALFILQNLGFQITTLLGGLGVAGLATAFAFQKILEDVFSFFLIYFDKPFRVGDYIVVGPDSGTVTNIGVRMTRLNAANGQELLISNRELTNSRLQNFKRMEKRRVIANFTLTYSAKVAQLGKVNKMVADICSKIKQIELDRVHLKSLAESGVTFEFVYFVKSNSYLDYMNAQQQLNLDLLSALEKHKLSLAYPTQTIEIKK